MPPARAAASTTASSKYSSNQRSTASWSRRSTRSRPTVKIEHFSCAKRRAAAGEEKSYPLSLPSLATHYGGPAGRVGKSGLVYSPLPARELDIMLDHHVDQLRERDPRLPAENCACLRGITTQKVHLGWSKITLIDLDVATPVESGCGEGKFDEFTHAMRLPGR